MPLFAVAYKIESPLTLSVQRVRRTYWTMYNQILVSVLIA